MDGKMASIMQQIYETFSNDFWICSVFIPFAISCKYCWSIRIQFVHSRKKNVIFVPRIIKYENVHKWPHKEQKQIHKFISFLSWTIIVGNLCKQQLIIMINVKGGIGQFASMANVFWRKLAEIQSKSHFIASRHIHLRQWLFLPVVFLWLWLNDEWVFWEGIRHIFAGNEISKILLY
jgi:hypothetical protein